MAGHKTNQQIYTQLNFTVVGLDKEMDDARKKFDEVSKSVNKLKKEMGDMRVADREGYSSNKAYKDKQAEMKNLQKQLEILEKEVGKVGEKEFNAMRDLINKWEDLAPREVGKLTTLLTKYRKNINDVGDVAKAKIEVIGDALNNLSARQEAINRGVADLLNMPGKDTTNKVLEERISLFNRMGESLAQDEKQYKQMGEVAYRTMKKLMENRGQLVKLGDATTPEQLKQNIESWKKLSTAKGASEGQVQYAKNYMAANEEKLNQMLDEQTIRSANKLDTKTIGGLSDSGIKSQLTYWTKLRDEWVLAKKDATELNAVIDRLAATDKSRNDQAVQSRAIEAWNKEVESAQKMYAVAKKLSDSGLQNLISKYTKLRDEAEAAGKPTAAMTAKISQLTAMMDARKENALTESLEKMHVNSEKLSDGSLNKLLSQYVRLREEWEADGKDASELTKIITDLERQSKERAELNAEIQADQAFKKETEAAQRMYKIYNDLSDGSLQSLINRYHKLREEMEASGKDASEFTNRIKELQEEQLGRKVGSVDTFLSNDNSLEARERAVQQYKKFAEEFATAGLNADQLKTKIASLEEGNAKLRTRQTETKGEFALQAVNSGQFTNITDMKQAIKDMEEYQKVLDISGEDGKKRYRELGEAIEKVKNEIEGLNGKYKTAEDAIAAFANGEKNAFGETADELEKSKKALEDYIKNLKAIGASEDSIFKAEQALEALNKQIKGEPKSLEYWQRMAKLMEGGRKSPKEMADAVKQLREQLGEMKTGDENFKKMSAALRDMDRQLKATNTELGHHVSILGNAFSRLKSYVLIYVGFNAAVQKVRTWFSSAETLSDKMTNVQKVTGLTNDQIERLTNSLQDLDTRNTTTQLLELAEAGGKLGLATRGGADALVQFASTAQQVTSTLGEDIGGAEAVADLLKVNDLLNKGATDSLEKQVKRIGSSILMVGNNSKASYGDVTNFTKRVGAVASTAHMTMPQVIALGGVFSALGASMEQAATSTNRLIIGINTRAREIGQITGLGADALQSMVDQGKSYEALMMVLDRIKGGGFQGIEAFLKTIGGKNNAQIKSNTALLMGNIELINQELALATNGYSEATLMTQEFNRANDNLAGTVQRTHNYLAEMFNNPWWQSVFTTLAKGWYNLIKLIHESAAAGATFYTILTAIAFGSMGAAAKLTVLGKELKGLLIAFGTGIKNVGLFFTYLTQAIFGVQGAMNKLKVLMAGNWITLIAAAIAGIVAWVIKLSTAVSDTAKMFAQFTEQLAEDSFVAHKLFLELEKGNTAIDRKRILIAQINEKYGSYLGFMLKESDTADMIAAAHRRVIQALKEEAAIKMRQKIIDQATEQQTENINDALTNINNGTLKNFKDDPEKAARLSNFLIEKATEYAATMKGSSARDIANQIFKEAVTFMNPKIKSPNAGQIGDIRWIVKDSWSGTYVQDLIEAQREVSTAIDNAQEYLDAMDKGTRKGQWSVNREQLKQLNADIKKRYKPEGLSDTDAQDLVDRMQSYINIASQYVGTGKSGKAFQKQIDIYQERIDILNKQLHKEEEFTPGKTDAELKKEHNEAVEQEKKALGSVMALLEEHFNTRTAAINDAYIRDEITYNERERELALLEQEHLNARIELRKKLLGKENSFNQSMYAEMQGRDIDAIARNLTLLGQAELDGIEKNMSADQAEVTKRISDIKHEIETILAENNPFDKLIDDLNTTLFNINVLIKDSEVDLLRNVDAMRDEQARRIALLVKLSQDAYSLTVDNLRSTMQNEGLERWAALLSDEEMQAIIEKVQKFGEDYNSSVERMASRAAKIFEMKWNTKGEDGLSKKDKWDAIFKTETNENNIDKFTNSMLGLITTRNGSTNADTSELALIQSEIDMYEMKIMLMEQEYKLAKERAMLNEDEAKRKEELQRLDNIYASQSKEATDALAASKQKLLDKMSSMVEAEMSQLSPYLDAIKQFGNEFGANIFGSKEARQAAARDLLNSVIDATQQITTQWLVELATHNMIEQAKAQQTEAAEQMQVAYHKKALAEKLGDDMLAAEAKQAIDDAKIKSEAATKNLWLGLAIGAAISLALGVLFNAAKSKTKAVQSEIAGSSSGKLVTGMLTYAKGRYPVYADGQYEVQGNDGRSYNARYEKELSTGVYGGGAHFGIFSERQPEAVIDGRTTGRVVMDYPAIWRDIVSLSRFGRLAPDSPYSRRMNTYADGNLSMIPAGNATGTVAGDATGTADSNAALASIIQQNNAIMAQLQAQLAAGLSVNMSMFGKNGLHKTTQKMNRYAERYGVE